MTPEQALTIDIESFAPLVNAVGKRVSPDFVREERSLPGIAYQRTDTAYFHTIHSPSSQSLSTFEVYVMAKTRTDSLQVGDLFDAAMREAKRYCVNRRSEFDADYDIWSSVFTVSVFVP